MGLPGLEGGGGGPTRISACMCVSARCAVAAAAVVQVGMGALAPLISISNAADLETQRCIAYGICNLASAEHHRDAIIHEGGLVPLISLACSEDVDDQLAAIGTLRGLAASPQCVATPPFARRHTPLTRPVQALR